MRYIYRLSLLYVYRDADVRVVYVLWILTALAFCGYNVLLGIITIKEVPAVIYQRSATRPSGRSCEAMPSRLIRIRVPPETVVSRVIVGAHVLGENRGRY